MLARLIATWFGFGYFPKAPGTAGSVAAVAIALLLVQFFAMPPWQFAVIAIALTPVGMWAAGALAQAMSVKDPQIVVVDEVIGQWIAYAGATHFNITSWIAGFILFRAFDMWKPAPVRQLEHLRGGVGIVADDMMAGVYAALVLFAAGWFNLY